MSTRRPARHASASALEARVGCGYLEAKELGGDKGPQPLGGVEPFLVPGAPVVAQVARLGLAVDLAPPGPTGPWGTDGSRPHWHPVRPQRVRRSGGAANGCHSPLAG